MQECNLKLNWVFGYYWPYEALEKFLCEHFEIHFSLFNIKKPMWQFLLMPIQIHISSGFENTCHVAVQFNRMEFCFETQLKISCEAWVVLREMARRTDMAGYLWGRLTGWSSRKTWHMLPSEAYCHNLCHLHTLYKERLGRN